MQDTCPHCGKMLRLGVRLTPLKSRIFDAIERAGNDGISAIDLQEIIFADKDIAGLNNLKSHVYQINQQLAVAGVHIYGRKHGYRLAQRPK